MRRLADKGILLACGLTLLFYRPQVGAIDVAALLTAVTLCALGSYCGERFRLAAGMPVVSRASPFRVMAVA